MNLDLSSAFNFGDDLGLRTFMLDHRLVHEQTASALTNRFGVPFSTFGIGSGSAEADWARLMRREDEIPARSAALQDWLLYHAAIHDASFQAIGGTGNLAPDLSAVDFSRQEQFYEWMYIHALMHDYEQQSLGLT